jgi:hypothetical protein
MVAREFFRTITTDAPASAERDAPGNLGKFFAILCFVTIVGAEVCAAMWEAVTARAPTRMPDGAYTHPSAGVAQW